MKILLIRPPAVCLPGASHPAAGLPIGLLSIAAVLEQAGYAVHVFDAQVHPSSPFFEEGAGVRFMGRPWQELSNEIARIAPDIVGITCPFTAQSETALRAARIVKSINRGTVTIIGGNSATVSPDYFLKNGDIDIVCRGEGEYTMLDVVRAIENGSSLIDVPGTVHCVKGTVADAGPRAFIEDLDALPLPAYHLVPVEDYVAMNNLGFSGRPVFSYPGAGRAFSVITSRGCPYDCIFCSIHLHMGRKWRAHSAAGVRRHITTLKEKYGIRHIHFEDDNLTLDTDRFGAILDDLKTAGITWDTPNGIRADRMTRDLVEKSAAAGCTYLILGIESGCPRVLSEIINKNLDLAKTESVARWCHDAGLDLGAFFVIGFPGETIPEMRQTADFALRLMRKYDVSPTIFTATPLIGTRLYSVCRENGFLTGDVSPENLAVVTGSGGNRPLIETKDFRGSDLVDVMEYFMRRYKFIFAVTLIRFFFTYPAHIVSFLQAVRTLAVRGGLKDALLELNGFKHCVRRRTLLQGTSHA